MILSYFKHYFVFLNVNEHLVVKFVKLTRDGSCNVNEHLAVQFVKLTRGGSCVGHLGFFCLHRITFLSISTVTHN